MPTFTQLIHVLIFTQEISHVCQKMQNQKLNQDAGDICAFPLVTICTLVTDE